MSRYRFDDEIRRTDIGKRYLATNLPKPVLTDNNYPITYITRQGDRLDLLAYKYYGSAMKWWVIARANNLVNGTISVAPGTKLIIPRMA